MENKDFDVLKEECVWSILLMSLMKLKIILTHLRF